MLEVSKLRICHGKTMDTRDESPSAPSDHFVQKAAGTFLQLTYTLTPENENI